MIVFRWVMGLIAGLSAAGALLSFVIFMLTEGRPWLQRTRVLRHWTWLALLLWFNVEVWGRVVVTLVNWNR